MSSILMGILTTRPIEDVLGWAMSNNRGHDAGMIARQPAIANCPKSITITSPDIGPSGSRMSQEYGSSGIGGKDRIPNLNWLVPEDVRGKVKEWVMVCEDPDAPMAEPIVHGIYLGIPASKTSVTPGDFEQEGEAGKVKGGFWYGRNRRGTVYIAPRPIARHGEHRYFFAVVGLGVNVDWEDTRKETGESGVDKNAILKAVDGKVVAWGEWVGTYERK